MRKAPLFTLVHNSVGDVEACAFQCVANTKHALTVAEEESEKKSHQKLLEFITELKRTRLTILGECVT